MYLLACQVNCAIATATVKPLITRDHDTKPWILLEDMWSLHGVYMEPTWSLGGGYLECTELLFQICSLHMEFTWSLGRLVKFHMEFTWWSLSRLVNFHMESTWNLYRLYIDSIWSPHRIHMESTWSQDALKPSCMLTYRGKKMTWC